MALPAFARRTAVRRVAIDRYLLPAGPTAANLQRWAHAGTDRRTDRRTPDRCVDLLRIVRGQCQRSTVKLPYALTLCRADVSGRASLVGRQVYATVAVDGGFVGAAA